MKKIIKTLALGFFVLTTFWLLSSCSSLPKKDSIYSSSTGSDNIKNIKQIEKDLVLQYKEYNSEKMSKIKIELDKLVAEKSADFEFLASVNALYADYYLVRRSKSKARKFLAKAKECSSSNELVLLVESRLISARANDEKIEFLTKLIDKNPNYYRLKSELAYTYYLNKDYTNALASFDSSLDFLPEEYTELYGEKRDYCRKFYTVDSDMKGSSSKIVSKSQIKMVEMTELCENETNALDFVTGTAHWKPLMLAEKLKANQWYNESANLKKDIVRRKDAALFLWHLIVGNNSKKLSRFSRRYAARGGKSPIPDVELDGVYFDSILGTVEEDIIPLIDGVKFDPDKPVSGLEFYNWLKKADRIKNY